KNWISYNIPSNIQNFGSIQITISIPYTPILGFFYQKLNITANNFYIDEVWVNFSVQYPSGRILFYKPTINFSFQDVLQIDDLLTLWTERLDTIYGGYFDFYNLCLINNYDVDDFSLIQKFNPNFSLDTIISIPFELPYQTSTLKENFTFISNYDLVIICDPEINLTQTEIETLIDFGLNGGSLFFWMEPETECEHYSINSILDPFGFQINESFNLITDQPFIIPTEHDISKNLTQIKLYTFTTFQNFSTSTIFTQYNNKPTLLLNDSLGKILCIGDSSLFNASCIAAADNFQFLKNSINWLLKDKINISIIINKENESEPLRISQNLLISIHVTLKNGSELFNNLTLYTFLFTPSNQCLYMIFFHVQEGWYNTIYFDNLLNETGSYFLVIYANSPSEVSIYATQHLILEEAQPSDDGDSDVHQNRTTRRQILFGMLTALTITFIIVGILFYQRHQWRRQMSIIDLKEKLQREISNLLSEYHLYIKEHEQLLQESKVLDPDKLRMVLDSQERKKDLIKKLKKLGKNV
ncbi:MAG: hypothetical protein ACFFD2_11825, partial [Promethearchaeota archaeon]